MKPGRKLLELAKRRRTIRKFLADPPPREEVLYALEVAKEAPSGMNAQPWHFLLVEDQELKDAIRAACEAAERDFYSRVEGKLKRWLDELGFTPEKPFLSQAPYLVLVLSQTSVPYWLQSTWLAIGYLLLALEERGLGTVTYTPPDPRAVSELVNAPAGYALQTILPIGYPDDPKPKYSRRGLAELLTRDRFPSGSSQTR